MLRIVYNVYIFKNTVIAFKIKPPDYLKTDFYSFEFKNKTFYVAFIWKAGVNVY